MPKRYQIVRPLQSLVAPSAAPRVGQAPLPNILAQSSSTVTRHLRYHVGFRERTAFQPRCYLPSLMRMTMSACIGVCLGLLTAGCATHSLWTDPWGEGAHEPSRPTRLLLFQAEQQSDILAQYDEVSPWRRTPQRRSYFIYQSLDQTTSYRKPRFESLNASNGLAMIPIYKYGDEITMQLGMYALGSTNGNRFTIYRKGQDPEGPFELPSYTARWKTVKRIVLTPFTLALDIITVEAVVLIIYCSESPTPHKSHEDSCF